MRDPEATLEVGQTAVRRALLRPLSDDHFLRSNLARRWVQQQRLVPFDVLDPCTTVSPRLAFVSHPDEWCDAQLFDAALHTLQLQQEAVAEGFDLKDASAWNVLYRGTEPVFCDLLSFGLLRQRKWWAAGQFARHFILPLLLSRRRGLLGHQVFKTWRDGVPPGVARRMLGPGRFLTRYWPLVAGGHDGSSAPTAASPATALEATDGAGIARFRGGLHASLGWMLGGVDPHARYDGARAGWSGYVDDRSHYDAHNVAAKRACIAEWVARVAPGWVADLGCNTGEFSLIALEQGAEVVALDADHDAVQRLYRSNTGMPRLHPLIARLDDLPGGRGWAGTEHAGLSQRFAKRFDLVLMLALIHHLAVAAAVPLSAVAVFAASCTRKWLMVEFIDETDPQLCLLCTQRQRTPAEFSVDRQREAFRAAGFVSEAELSLKPAARVLALLRLPT